MVASDIPLVTPYAAACALETPFFHSSLNVFPPADAPSAAAPVTSPTVAAVLTPNAPEPIPCVAADNTIAGSIFVDVSIKSPPT